MSELTEQRKELRLNSPVGGEALVFQWPLIETKKYSGSTDIIETIKMVMGQYQELKTVINNFVRLDQIDVNDYDSMRSLCLKFSKAAGTISGLWKGATKPGGENWSAEKADRHLLRQIITRSYNRAIVDPKLLNKHYEAFSSQTYGETSFDRLQMIIEELALKDRDVFVDLGSGVGQVIVHLAGGSKVKKSIGIEIASVPAQYAKTLKFEFVRWMKWYGKKFRSFELHHADFLNSQFRDLITKEATVIFVNNFAFTSDLEDLIKCQLLSEMKDGTRVISTRAYAHPSRPITDRQMTDLSAIMDVREMNPCPNPCSWTSAYVPYYLHIINRAKLEKYFLSQRLPALRSDSYSSGSNQRSSSSSNRGSSRESSISKDHAKSAAVSAVVSTHDNSDDVVFGPTTRRKWNDYLSQLKRNKKQIQKTKQNPAVVSSDSQLDTKKFIRKSGKAVKKEDDDEDEHSGFWTGKANRRQLRKSGNSVDGRRRSTAKRLTDTDRAGLELMHDLVLSQQKATHPPESAEQTMHVFDLPLAESAGLADDEATEGDNKRKFPELDELIEVIRRQYEMQIDHMKTDDFRRSVVQAIEAEQTRKLTLQFRVDCLTKQVDHLQKDGVKLLKQRLVELNIQAETPAELLNQSKEIVLRHKELQLEHSQLEKENATLAEQNNRLVALCRERDEQLVHSGTLQAMGFPEQLTIESAKEIILRDIGINFGRNRSLLCEIARVQAELATLESNLPVVVQTNDQKRPQSSSIVKRTGTQSLASIVGNRPTKRSRQRSRSIRANCTMSGLSTRPRKHTVRPVETMKTVDPQRQEEIERQIQDIVQKALSVDSAAKSAEKERKAKSAERKRVGRSTVIDTMTRLNSTDESPNQLTFCSPGLVPITTKLPVQSSPMSDSTDTESAHSEESGGHVGTVVSIACHSQYFRNRAGSVPSSQSRVRMPFATRSNTVPITHGHSEARR